MTQSQLGTAYSLSGVKGAPVIALIHGIGINRHIWREYQSTLSGSCRVLSYDLYGHGESLRPGEPLTLSVFANQLRELLDELEIEKCTAVGFSMGGMINRRFAMDYPDRVSGLVIMNSPHERSSEAQALVEERVANTAAGGPEATIEESMTRWFTTEFLASGDPWLEKVRGWILSNNPRSYTESRMILAKSVTELIRPQPPIRKPALVMTCENDSGSTPAMSHAIASEIAGAETVIVPELQHLGMLENTAAFLEPIKNFFFRTLT